MNLPQAVVTHSSDSDRFSLHSALFLSSAERAAVCRHPVLDWHDQICWESVRGDAANSRVSFIQSYWCVTEPTSPQSPLRVSFLSSVLWPHRPNQGHKSTAAFFYVRSGGNMRKSHSEVLRAWQVKKSQHACHLTSKGMSQTDLYFCR